MTSDKLTKHWRQCYGIEPRAHDLRSAWPDRWLRIHGLPDGKRYPETPEEYSVVLHRHNEALSALLPAGTQVILVTTGDSLAENPAPVQDGELQHPAAWHWTTILIDPDDPLSNFWHLYARGIVWQPGILDAALRRVADWESMNVIIIGVAQRVAYHPYDGGADIITRDKRQRDSLRNRFRDWLPPLPIGL
ncbi:MAG: hypothetical protein NTU53_14030 [Planctomycetota bacterium]|nr:hypothetical protein [Planctomycetota bacterium]